MESTEAQLAASIAKYTNEPLEVVSARLDARCGSPEIRQEIANNLQILFHTNSYTPVELYKAIIELSSTLIFGKNRQIIDLSCPPILSSKDIAIISSLNRSCFHITNFGLSKAEEKLQDIPVPIGSEADKGTFDGYNQEVLFVVGSIAEDLRNLIPSSDEDFRAAQRTETLQKSTRNISKVISGLGVNDREAVFLNYGFIRRRAEKLLAPPQESSIEKTIKSISSRFSHLFTKN